MPNSKLSSDHPRHLKSRTLCGKGVQPQWKIHKFSSRRLRCPKYPEFDVFTMLFRRERPRNAQKKEIHQKLKRTFRGIVLPISRSLLNAKLYIIFVVIPLLSFLLQTSMRG